MTQYFILLLTLLSTLSACGQSSIQKGQTAATAAQSTANAETITYRQHNFDLYKVDISKQQVELFLENEEGEKFRSIGKLKQWLEAQDKTMIFATNAGMYLPHKNNEPQGLYISEGIERNPLNLKDTTRILNFYMKPNGVFVLTPTEAKVVESTAYPILTDSIVLATQSGPMLVIDGALHHKFREQSTNTYIRSGVGIIDDTHIVFAISQEPVNFWTFGMLFKEYLGCDNALYLDGAISKMYAPELGRHDLDGNFGGIFVIGED